MGARWPGFVHFGSPEVGLVQTGVGLLPREPFTAVVLQELLMAVSSPGALQAPACVPTLFMFIAKPKCLIPAAVAELRESECLFWKNEQLVPGPVFLPFLTSTA